MSRIKPKSGTAAWSAGPLELSADARVEIASLLGFDAPPGAEDQIPELSKALEDVETILGFYAGAVDSLGNAPRPAHIQLASQQVADSSNRLLEDLKSLHSWIRDSLNQKLGSQDLDFDLDDMENQLSHLESSAKAVASEQGDSESRGRPTSESAALREVVRRLRKVFYRSVAGRNSSRREQGAVNWLSEPEQDEVEFICMALDDVQIPHPRNLRKVIQHPECALPHERRKLIERLSDKVSSRRQREQEDQE